MAPKTPNRVYQYTTTAGQGSVTLDGDAVLPNFFKASEVGLAVGARPHAVIEEGNDVEIVRITITSVGPPVVFSRDTVTKSRINGVAGTTKMTLLGAATVQFVIEGSDYERRASLDDPNAWLAPQTADPVAVNNGVPWDGGATQYHIGVVNGSAFNVRNPLSTPQTLVPNTVYLFKFSYVTAHTVNFATQFKGLISTPTAAAGAVDYFMFMSNQTGTRLDFLGAALNAAA